MLYEIFLIIMGFFLLIKGADFVIKGASSIAKKFYLSDMFIGIIIIGIGTSLPEIIVTIKSTITGNSDIIIGNSIGSCICNLLLVIGVASICNPLKMDEQIIKLHLPISAFTIFTLAIFCNFGKDNYIISQYEGIILLIFTIIYILYTIYERKEKSGDRAEIEYKNTKIINLLIYLILGIIGLKYGADFVVDGTVTIAKFLGVSESIIGITIVSLGTSLPEIVTCITATLKKEENLAIGNVIGSNIFNICLLPGISAMIRPIQYNMEFNRSFIFLFIITVYLVIDNLFKNRRVISRSHGVIFILLFCLYISCLF